LKAAVDQADVAEMVQLSATTVVVVRRSRIVELLDAETGECRKLSRDPGSTGCVAGDGPTVAWGVREIVLCLMHVKGGKPWREPLQASLWSGRITCVAVSGAWRGGGHRDERRGAVHRCVGYASGHARGRTGGGSKSGLDSGDERVGVHYRPRDGGG